MRTNKSVADSNLDAFTFTTDVTNVAKDAVSFSSLSRKVGIRLIGGASGGTVGPDSPFNPYRTRCSVANFFFFCDAYFAACFADESVNTGSTSNFLSDSTRGRAFSIF